MNLYLPDGSPVDGPVTTAAEYAHEVAAVRQCCHGSVEHVYRGEYLASSMTARLWRNAAAREGALYSEAINGARAMRADSRLHMKARAHYIELDHGIPAGWMGR